MSREELIKARERVVRQFTLWERCYRKEPDRQHKNVIVTVDNTALKISGVVKRTAGKYKGSSAIIRYIQLLNTLVLLLTRTCYSVHTLYALSF